MWHLGHWLDLMTLEGFPNLTDSMTFSDVCRGSSRENSKIILSNCIRLHEMTRGHLSCVAHTPCPSAESMDGPLYPDCTACFPRMLWHSSRAVSTERPGHVSEVSASQLPWNSKRFLVLLVTPKQAWSSVCPCGDSPWEANGVSCLLKNL